MKDEKFQIPFEEYIAAFIVSSAFALFVIPVLRFLLWHFSVFPLFSTTMVFVCCFFLFVHRNGIENKRSKAIFDSCGLFVFLVGAHFIMTPLDVHKMVNPEEQSTSVAVSYSIFFLITLFCWCSSANWLSQKRLEVLKNIPTLHRANFLETAYSQAPQPSTSSSETLSKTVFRMVPPSAHSFINYDYLQGPEPCRRPEEEMKRSEERAQIVAKKEQRAAYGRLLTQTFCLLIAFLCVINAGLSKTNLFIFPFSALASYVLAGLALFFLLVESHKARRQSAQWKQLADDLRNEFFELKRIDDAARKKTSLAHQIECCFLLALLSTSYDWYNDALQWVSRGERLHRLALELLGRNLPEETHFMKHVGDLLQYIFTEKQAAREQAYASLQKRL